MTDKLIDHIKYLEVTELPKFKVQLDRLLNRNQYDCSLDVHDIPGEKLADFVMRATEEGNAVLVQRQYCSYMVILWKDD